MEVVSGLLLEKSWVVWHDAKNEPTSQPMELAVPPVRTGRMGDRLTGDMGYSERCQVFQIARFQFLHTLNHA